MRCDNCDEPVDIFDFKTFNLVEERLLLEGENPNLAYDMGGTTEKLCAECHKEAMDTFHRNPHGEN